ncbi:MAG TPA: glycine cleavage system protein GcvH [Planctomycetia bacterium]|nr:glycine cleavage system protein GcvH [Planctomycetia bacterium]
MDENKLLYAESHEWADVRGTECYVGISRFAVEQLTDITYVELPKVGTAVTAGKSFGVIESVKSANDLYAPISGTVTKINEAVAKDPSILSQDPYEKGWMIAIDCGANPSTANLKNKADYDAQVAAGH